MDEETVIGGSRHMFPHTMWGSILNAVNRDSDTYKKDLEYLISTYWKPVYSFIRYKWRKSNEEAKDLTQSFFTYFLEKDSLRHVSPEKGKFRTYVRASLHHFLIKNERDRMALKHGGGAVRINFEEVEENIYDRYGTDDPEVLFDRQWAHSLFMRTLERLKSKLTADGKDLYFEIFDIYNSSDKANPTSYKELAEKFNIKVTDVRNHLSYTRSLLRKLVREEVGKCVQERKDVDDEVKYIISLVK